MSSVARSESGRGDSESLDGRLRDLLGQQAALRELAVAVGEMRAPEVIYELVAKEASEVACVGSGAVIRFRVDGFGEVVGSWRMGSRHTGSLIPLDGSADIAIVARTGRAARTKAPNVMRPYEPVTEQPSPAVTLAGGVAVPIRVRRELWGCLLVVAAAGEQIAPDLEERLGIFADLIGLAITNTDWSTHLLSQATSDPLTGLLNHRAFQERVESEVGRAQRYERPLALVLLDLDHFKSINDAYGHQAGDAALVQAARLLEAGARVGDVLGRIGGDEFALLLPETSAEQAVLIADRWADGFRAAPVGVAAHLTTSVGVCDLSHANGSRELLHLADNALYWAKSQGRDNVAAYSPESMAEPSGAARDDRMQRLQSFTAIHSLTHSVDAKDSPTREHSRRVSGLAQQLAEASGWTPTHAALLAQAALIHDIGKIGVPEHILRKPGPLTADEYELIKTHPALSAQMARDSLDDEQVVWIEQHHERYDGEGYPSGLAGAGISEGAALLALADSWDAMTTGRSYRPAKAEPEALAECLSLAGSQFSPSACTALAAILTAQGALQKETR